MCPQAVLPLLSSPMPSILPLLPLLANLTNIDVIARCTAPTEREAPSSSARRPLPARAAERRPPLRSFLATLGRGDVPAREPRRAPRRR